MKKLSADQQMVVNGAQIAIDVLERHQIRLMQAGLGESAAYIMLRALIKEIEMQLDYEINS